MTPENISRFIIPFAILFFLLGVLWTQLGASHSNDTDGMIGQAVPAFSVPSAFGGPNLTNQSLQGHVSLLNFWATWCSACRYEHPMLMKISSEYHIPIYGIAFKNTQSEVQNVLKNDGNPYTEAAYDLSGTTGVEFGIYATPETLVISPSGHVIYRQIGIIDQRVWDTTIYPLIKRYQEANS